MTTITSTALSEKEFTQIRNLVYDRFGINLTDQKKALVVGRLQKLLRVEGFHSFQEYYDFVLRDPSGSALDKLINSISTNYTFFNRESAHFGFFKDTALPAVISKLKAEANHDLRIWCAGCSTGEEPYMLAILLMEYLGSEYGLWNGGILATDISDRVLTLARQGVYQDEQVRSIPKQLLHKYFIRQPGERLRVHDKLRQEVLFRRFNLMNTQFPFKKKFHIVFCRNVMIYFDNKTREELVSRIHAFMEPGGFFFIGHSETIGRQQTLFRYLQPALYQKL